MQGMANDGRPSVSQPHFLPANISFSIYQHGNVQAHSLAALLPGTHAQYTRIMHFLPSLICHLLHQCEIIVAFHSAHRGHG